VGDGCGIPYSLYRHIAPDGFNYRFAVQIPGFDPEFMVGEFPKIKTQADYHGKLGMYTGEIPGNNGIKGTDNGKFPGVLLRKIAKGK